MSKYDTQKITIELTDGSKNTELTVKDLKDLAREFMLMRDDEERRIIVEANRELRGEANHPGTMWAWLTSAIFLLSNPLLCPDGRQLRAIWRSSAQKWPDFKSIRRIILPNTGYDSDYGALVKQREEIWVRMNTRQFREPTEESSNAKWISDFRDAARAGTVRKYEHWKEILEDSCNCTVLGLGDSVFVVPESKYPGTVFTPEAEDDTGWMEVAARAGCSAEQVLAVGAVENDISARLAALGGSVIDNMGELELVAGNWRGEVEEYADNPFLCEKLEAVARKAGWQDPEVSAYFLIDENVKDWLAETGACVFDWNGQTIWGRITCGQHISMDGAVGEIGVNEELFPGLRNSWYDPTNKIREYLGYKIVGELIEKGRVDAGKEG